MVKNNATPDNSEATETTPAPAVKAPAKKPAAKKTPAKSTAAKASKPAAKAKDATVDAEATAAEQTTAAAKKAPARGKAASKSKTDEAAVEAADAAAPAAKKNTRTKKGDSAKVEVQAATAEAPAAPVSSFGLMFMAPDLPTPVIDPKKGKIIDAPAEDGESHLRRRSRRRAGESVDGDVAANTVVKVREPRAPKEPSNEPQRVKGSTRLEAKKQRRREGREAGRRRAPILTEAEFLARRESVNRVMAVRQRGDRTQIAVLEDGVLVEHYVTRGSQSSMVGNVYLGRVQNVLPSMEADVRRLMFLHWQLRSMLVPVLNCVESWALLHWIKTQTQLSRYFSRYHRHCKPTSQPRRGSRLE